MCGIVGYVGSNPALEVIIDGLQKLEYRGYDSAGVAVFENGEITISRAMGKLSELRNVLAKSDNGKSGSLGIGHTRWATHGKPSETNAHPHRAGRISLIHNGIIENYVELREQLEGEGCVFVSETDTEIAAHLLNKFVSSGLDPFDALTEACKHLKGSYAFLAVDEAHPDRILVAKNSTPIVVGRGENESYVASDIPAILGRTREFLILEDGDIAEVKADSVRIENHGKPVERPIETITWDPVTAQKGGFKHYMLKEIHEQSLVLAETFRGRINFEKGGVSFGDVALSPERVRSLKRVVLAACGTAWHACLVAKFYLEEFTGIPCEVDYASELRYRSAILDEDTLFVVISQSGETADTLAALELAAKKGAETLAICNVLGSSIARKVKHRIFTQAGPEISVASTKAFTTQIVASLLLSLYLGERRGTLSVERISEVVSHLVHLPTAVQKAVETEDAVTEVAKSFYAARDFLFLGRGICYPIALEGALKLKEISYIHAEGYPAGEMKHGPIALIDEQMPVVVVLQKSDLLFDKTLSNLREVHSRAGRIIAITDTAANKELASLCENVIEVPYLAPELSPIVLTIPLQLLAYHVAIAHGTDVD
ncbi:MAG: glutamine--fructose-6-phosphate transaminase (isomerizing), partial [Bdellovibrionales bacterium]|nr:glutamine--fructose-6-phosphate transaminase (isomerizing) [Bdellovibrionales bacterium]